MDMEYDRKFEEMKKYVPFLESMIKRLESTSSGSKNPRQAQLDKIRSLRDLLLDKKKRMKMDNLLKCEQVLVNLYAKVEQKDTLPGIVKSSDSIFTANSVQSKDNNLEVIRNKLKNVTKLQEDIPDTLPEIARASEAQDISMSGSKEPALFQRRPNMPGCSAVVGQGASVTSQSRRNYTRVLISPERSPKRWLKPEQSPSEKPLFVRRSPRRSPRRYSPTYYKRERKKSSKLRTPQKPQDLNITLKVPEESLNSLNTKDILSRIINCSDSDVDIDTLRELRTQILGELKQTGAKDDISDLIIKSSKKKKKSKHKEEVEEGELSDSESEAIESIYGSLVILDKEQNVSGHPKVSNKEDKKPRKIQIRLVINSEKESTSITNTSNLSKTGSSNDVDGSEFEMYPNDSNIPKKAIDDKQSENVVNTVDDTKATDSSPSCSENKANGSEAYVKGTNTKTTNDSDAHSSAESSSPEDKQADEMGKKITKETAKETVTKEEITFKPNFYKPLTEQVSNADANLTSKPNNTEISQDKRDLITDVDEKDLNVDGNVSKFSVAEANKIQDSVEMPKDVEIPLLHEPSIASQKPKESVVSEIDILQALKNEILSENISIPGTSTVTPALHQPKLTKVASSQEIVSKKKISIEKYKEKTIGPPISPLFSKKSREDQIKKQSLKLTEKECERFKFALDEDEVSSDDDCKSVDDIYGDLAPKSPDENDSNDVITKPPVIIPADPIKNVVVNSETDVDMRTMIPTVSPHVNPTPLSNISPSPIVKETPLIGGNINVSPAQNKNTEKARPVDPRLKRDLNQISITKESPNSNIMNPERTPRPLVNFPNMTPNRTPTLTPSITPNARTFEMTPRQSIEIEDQPLKKHVYAPLFEPRDYRDQSVSREVPIAKWDKPGKSEITMSRWEKNDGKDRNRNSSWQDNSSKGNTIQRDSQEYQKYNRYNDSYNHYKRNARNDRSNYDNRDDNSVNRSPLECPQTPVNMFVRSDTSGSLGVYRQESSDMSMPPFGRSEIPGTPSHPFGRSECPLTPSHPFGRSEIMTPRHSFGGTECPRTPSHPFGRSDCPPTPVHPYGESECPPTPSHYFGRSDCPLTPVHPFGRSDCPSTPSHPFGRSDMPMTPSHPFGRLERDPRLHRKSEYEFSAQKDNRDRGYYKDRNTSYKTYTHEVNRNIRETSVGRNDRHQYRRPGHDEYHETDKTTKFHQVESRPSFQRERSVGRTAPSEDRNIRSNTRACSVGKNYDDQSDDSTLSVKLRGHSFTIDTSVKNTFQDFRKKGTEPSIFDRLFDSRRQRASSVGRSLVRESSVGRSISRSYSTHSPEDRNRNFRRAQSVARDTEDSKINKSFSEIKADFRSFKLKENKNKDKNSSSFTKNETNSRNKDSSYESRSKKYSQYNSKQPYSPRKNYRDPRLHRDSYNDSRNRHNDKHGYDSHDRKKYGIVYSNDNIASGSILGSGYGVKNYKIPKIKRPVDDTSEKGDEKSKSDSLLNKKEIDKKPEKYDENLKSDNLSNEKKTNKKPEKEISKKENSKAKDMKSSERPKRASDTKTHTENSGKKLTRASYKIKGTEWDNSDDEVVIKTTKKPKRPLQDSDSESEEGSSKYTTVTVKDNVKPKPTCDEKSITNDKGNEKINKDTNESEKRTNKSVQNENLLQKQTSESKTETNPKSILDPSFADDLEIFSDNIVTDPVIDNINALIADLDDDISTSKIETMLESMESHPDADCTKQMSNELSLNDINEIIEQDVQYGTKTLAVANEELITKNKKDSVSHSNSIRNQESCDPNTHNINSTDGNQPLKTSPISESMPNKHTTEKYQTEDLVSTTDVENGSPNNSSNQNAAQNQNNNPISTPDSTNTGSLTKQPCYEDSLPDSTNEVQNETSDVSSSHNSVEPSTKETEDFSSSSKEPAPGVDSIESILSLLQNKSKIKELLSMLGDQSNDNEKIKKKLEKLSEIVSDDEDINDDKQNISSKSVKENQNDLIGKINEKNISQDESEVTTSDTIKKDFSSKTCKANQYDSIEKCDGKDTSVGNLEINDSDMIGKEKDNDTLSNDDKVQSGNEQQKVIISRQKQPATKHPIKKGRITKRRRGKFVKKVLLNDEKRVTRSEAATHKPAKQKVSRELLQLQEDIKEMFISDEILNATGIRMCRLAKLVDDKPSNQKEDTISTDTEPVVVLEKFKNKDLADTSLHQESKSVKVRKKPGPKSKIQPSQDISNDDCKSKVGLKYKPGPKSKTKLVKKQDDLDPYAFETDSIKSCASKPSEDSLQNSSESDQESLASSKSFGSTEVLAELKKKPKRKRSSWKTGVIKPKQKKKKEQKPATPISKDQTSVVPRQNINIPDFNCFTDKSYCFVKNVSTYSCRLCIYSGIDIVAHYKNEHPHAEIPLSRPSPEIAAEAISQCEEINFQAINNIPMEKFVCRFCYREFSRKKAALESFFWHVVSTHTGEYKHLSSLESPFSLDIPPPPKDCKGQLIGYICGKCYFTQISLENLKTHVIVRHNDEQTEVYAINLAVISKRIINILSKRNSASEIEKPRVLRSSRSNQSMTETSDDQSDIADNNDLSVEFEKAPKRSSNDNKPDVETKTKMKSKITFENDDSASEASNSGKDTIKEEREDPEEENRQRDNQEELPHFDVPSTEIETQHNENLNHPVEPSLSDDIFAHPHFKVTFTESGSKEFVCCINGKYHYKTTFLISIKKHVQKKHDEIWDGFCFVCKVIVMPQGKHSFMDCLQHFLDKHMDEFPVMEKIVEPPGQPVEELAPIPREPTPIPLAADPLPTERAPTSRECTPTPRPYINVRPISQLRENPSTEDRSIVLPKIESVVSLGANMEPVIDYPPPVVAEPSIPPVPQSQLEEFSKYEEAQAKLMSTKHPVVLETMLTKEKLVKVYKCSGSFCSFGTDSAEVALVHALTHQQIGGENALLCAYCDFDCAGNAIDLVVHVFKHSNCQYSCRYCFYRAVSGQLVAAHINRTHSGKSVNVLVSTKATTPTPDTQNMLARELVVHYYVCNHEDDKGRCKYRTYTARKFCDHIQQRHANAREHTCYICFTSTSSATDLIQHMKSHDLNLYQCTWCVHGADSEADLLAHASAKHPNKSPQAYLRIITNKDGSSEYRVLPLASFNKTNISIEEVPTSSTNENAVKEAERSLELEKLIGQTRQMFELLTSESDKTQEKVPEPIQSMPPESNPRSRPITPETQISGIVEPQIPEIPSQSTPPRVPTPASISNENITQKPLSILKIEPPDNTPAKDTADDVVCLDSDEDTSRPSVIDVSDDETPPDSHEIVPVADLFKCSVCGKRCKTFAGLKTHLVMSCGKKNEPIKCAHCPLVRKNRDDLLKHYIEDHKSDTVYVCGICSKSFIFYVPMRKHMRHAHKVTNFVTTLSDKKTVVNAASATSTPTRQQPKRKLSSTSAPEPPPKLKRYGPQDVDRLPINPILDDLVHCSLCEFKTKVRLNMVRHLQLHGEQQPVPQTAPVNPVPHLETNEKHFDKMVNLASSSIVTRAPDKQTRPEADPVVSLFIPPEAASRYPKYVPERQRHTCGAKGCSYISVDEAMLKCHWETLHSGTSDYHCVHCPPYQHLNTSKPLTALRIMTHLKMHDTTLYACSSCSYYHYKRPILEKHLNEVHKGQGRIMVVREETSTPGLTSTSASGAPTMDLKAWQCGLCKFKSMLRPEVVEHCAKMHQSKMQHKCAYCPFRTSTLENVVKHQANSHPGHVEDVLYYYYREGSMPDAPDGTPHWMKQREKFGVTEPEVKTEVADTSFPKTPEPSTFPKTPEPHTPSLNIDLNIVKKELDESNIEYAMSVDELCEKYGQFCEPNGLKYKCCLCKVVTEGSKDAMRSHLYEELQYRKWRCSVCSYKAFHKTGLFEHMSSEHRGPLPAPVELPLDANIEKWVAKLLDHQTALIEKNKENFAMQKIQVPTPSTSTSTPVSKTPLSQTKVVESSSTTPKPTMKELETAFGQLGVSNNLEFCCPKCIFRVKDETVMRDHLESELTKIRWCCSVCSKCFQTYHEVQFHCKSAHVGQAARPKEAIRDPAMRSAWVSAVIQVQKLSMKCMPLELTQTQSPEKQPVLDNTAENSLLVVRYEEKVPTPEELAANAMNRTTTSPSSPESDEDRLIIDDLKETVSSKGPDGSKLCPYCSYSTKYSGVFHDHIVRHYNLYGYSCGYCNYNSYRQQVTHHIGECHPDKPVKINRVPIPTGPPTVMKIPVRQRLSATKRSRQTTEEPERRFCLICQGSFLDQDLLSHNHNNEISFAKNGDVVSKCCICLVFRKDMAALKAHHEVKHLGQNINYELYQIMESPKGPGEDSSKHKLVLISQFPTPSKSLEESEKPPAPKRIAKKSTTKLPMQAVAKKSTTKLPFFCLSDDDEEYSYYGTKPQSLEEFSNVTTLMPFCNMMMPFKLKKLSEIINIEPKVYVQDVNK